MQANSTQGRRWEATAVFEQAPPPFPRRLLLLLGGGIAAVALAILLLLFMPGDGGDGERPSAPLGALLSCATAISSRPAQNSYSFTASAGQRVNLDVRDCASNGTLVWTLRRPDDEPVFKDESMCSGDSPSDQEDVTLPQAGDYRLIVSGSEAATGTYRVKLQSR